MASLAVALERKSKASKNGTSRPEDQRRDAFEVRLTDRILGYVRAADVGEESRRRHDRLGAKMYYGQHWDRPMPSDRAAITANISMAILRHKVAIMTKQDPIPIIEPDDVGDARAAQLMAKVIRRLWMSTRMREKSRRLITLSNATRTCALKVSWDPVARGGAGDIATDVITPWNLVLDNRVGDPMAMEYCGNRATMNRSRAMLLYPDAAHKIRELVESNNTKKQFNLMGAGSPISTPWKASYIAPPGATIINGKPTITAFAGEIAKDSPGLEDVDVIEMYHRDHTLIEKEIPVRDPLGQIKKSIARGDDGMPQFQESEPEMHETEDGKFVMIPRFELVMEEVTESQLVRKYPHWRRTTIAVAGGGGALLEDRAWDLPLPYALYTDIEPLDGILGRGSLLQTEHLQALTNVGLSTVTDTLRYGALCAWLAGTSSGITSTQIIPGIGQVIPVNDITQMKALEVSPLDPQFFTLLDRAVLFMERILGATGVMQGESAGRVDSAAGYDTLAEIGGSTLVECTQRFETTLATWAEICGVFAQKFYDEKHAIAVEDQDTGNITWERASSELLIGSFSYTIATGSTMAWSESSKNARALTEYTSGLIDRQSYYEDTKKPNWRQILARIEAVSGPQGALGPAASPPPRMRASATKPPKPTAPKK